MGRKLYRWKVIPAPLPMIQLEAERNRRTYVISDQEEQNMLTAALEDGNTYIWLFIRIGRGGGAICVGMGPAQANFTVKKRYLLVQNFRVSCCDV